MPESGKQTVTEVPDNAWAVILAALCFYEDDTTSRDSGDMARTALDVIKVQRIGEQPGGQDDGSAKQPTG